MSEMGLIATLLHALQGAIETGRRTWVSEFEFTFSENLLRKMIDINALVQTSSKEKILPPELVLL